MFARRDFLRATSLGLRGLAGLPRAFAQGPQGGKAEVAAPPAADAAGVRAGEPINQLLAAIRDRHRLPGLIGGLVVGDALASVGAVGVRKLGAPEAFEVNDRLHLGSDTKAMTATMIGTVVEEGKLGWSTAVREVFPEQAAKGDEGVGAATLWELLTHRAGLPANALWRLLGRALSTTDQRRELLARMLRIKTLSKPGTKFAYSNVGYGLAALMAEQVTGRSWETLMRERLFGPLGMASAGFGPPGTPAKVDQPWGHWALGPYYGPTQGDNAAVLGPAGTVHCSLPDWARFAVLHLDAARGRPRLLKADTFRMLHTPPPGSTYAGGWVVADVPWSGGPAFTHSGSNTMWFATIWIAPRRDLALMVATNCGNKAAIEACAEAVEAIVAHHAAADRRKP